MWAIPYFLNMGPYTKPLSQIASFTSSAVAIYFVSVVDKATIDCIIAL
jgi:hypothetical protein